MRLPWKREKALSATPAVLEALRDLRVSPYPPLGGTNVNISAAWQRGISATYGWMYSTQPAVRAVIDFIARNASQISPPKLYERIDDTERERRSDHPAAKLLAYPDGRTPGDSWFYRVFTDFLIWDNAFILKFKPRSTGQLSLLRLPPGGVTVAGGRFTPTEYFVWDQYGKSYPVDPDNIIHWFGYHPDDPLTGLSKLETLRQELAVDSALQTATVELAKNGLKGGYIERPLEAPLADQDDLNRIAEMWKAGKLRGDPILDEGMKFVQSGVTPKDADTVATRNFTRDEVCVQYGVPLAAMGLAEGDPESARKLVYADVIPPYVGPLACLLNIGLLQQEYAEDDLYFEFNMDEKLRGDITERAAQYTSAAGAPWITRNEIRAKENLPPIEGADDLIKPLNVTEEGAEEDQGGGYGNDQIGAGYGGEGYGQPPRLPAPNVMPIQQYDKPPQDGSYRTSPKRFDPHQPRDPGGEGGGRWIRVAGNAAIPNPSESAQATTTTRPGEVEGAIGRLPKGSGLVVDADVADPFSAIRDPDGTYTTSDGAVTHSGRSKRGAVDDFYNWHTFVAGLTSGKPLMTLTVDRAENIKSARPPRRDLHRSVLDGQEGDLIEIIDRHWDRQERRVLSSKSTEVVKAEHSQRELVEDIRAVFGDGVDAERVAAGIGALTVKALDGAPPREAFEQLRKDARRWAADIDRARVLLVAASLADDASAEE